MYMVELVKGPLWDPSKDLIWLIWTNVALFIKLRAAIYEKKMPLELAKRKDRIFHQDTANLNVSLVSLLPVYYAAVFPSLQFIAVFTQFSIKKIILSFGNTKMVFPKDGIIFYWKLCKGILSCSFLRTAKYLVG